MMSGQLQFDLESTGHGLMLRPHPEARPARPISWPAPDFDAPIWRRQRTLGMLLDGIAGPDHVDWLGWNGTLTSFCIEGEWTVEQLQAAINRCVRAKHTELVGLEVVAATFPVMLRTDSRQEGCRVQAHGHDAHARLHTCAHVRHRRQRTLPTEEASA